MTTDTLDLYSPEPLLEGFVEIIKAAAAAASPGYPVEVGVGLESQAGAAITLWPSGPVARPEALAANTVASMRVQATCVGTNVNHARSLGGQVRSLFGRDNRGRLRHPRPAPGYVVLDIESGNDGHGDNSGGVPTWKETFVVLFTITGSDPGS